MPSVLLPGLDATTWQQAEGPGPAAVSWARGRLAGHDVVAAVWDFAVMGGTFGERDATAWVDACGAAERARVPLIAVTSSGGTRVQEGIPGLAGMARATIARERLSAAGVPVIAVVGQPTAGGVWVTVGSRADVRIAVRHATVGFAGPRVVEAVTGVHVGDDSHTAESALAAGLVDVVVAAEGVEAIVVRLLSTLSAEAADVEGLARSGAPAVVGDRDPWATVESARRPRRWSAGSLLAGLVSDAVPRAAPHGDTTA
ncbi:MAG TPA: carboxyl transferase domain-containing protein, partial [Mycobacteriales bacterium]|nr:carboxyl transferase domain-containing protein [Mycobacteriales bacterium]